LTRKLRPDLQGADHDEAYTAGIHAMERAVSSYVLDHDAALTTVVYAAVEKTLTHFQPGGPIAVPKKAVFKREALAARRPVGLWRIEDEVELPRRESLDELERQEITEALELLHPRDRKVIIAIDFERRSLTETAAHLGLSRSQVRVSR